MKKKKIVSLLLTGLLTVSMSSATLAATNDKKEQETGRVEQQRVTGIISINDFEEVVNPNVTENIKLTGTIKIDGPELVFEVKENGEVVKDGITVTKNLDGTYDYCVEVSTAGWEDNVTFTFNAKTVYKNGKNAGQTHTLAKEVEQVIEVEIPQEEEHLHVTSIQKNNVVVKNVYDNKGAFKGWNVVVNCTATYSNGSTETFDTEAFINDNNGKNEHVTVTVKCEIEGCEEVASETFDVSEYLVRP